VVVAKPVMVITNLLRVISHLRTVIRNLTGEIINLSNKNRPLQTAVGQQSSHVTNFFVLQPD
jgi:hypothetical protein